MVKKVLPKHLIEFLIGKFYNFGAIKQLLCCWKYIVSAITMGLFVIFIDKIIVSDISSLIVGLISGVFSYILCLLLLKDFEFVNLLNKIRGK